MRDCMTDLSKISTERLEKMMFYEARDACVGGVVGVLAIALASLWRWVSYPPRLVIRYKDGAEVWSFQDTLWRDSVPTVGVADNALYATMVALGIFCAWYSSRRWRAIWSELVSRHTRMAEVSE